jgi:NAD(P)-dependent dehydrogenase (short-subunit alcohol dehydrogenase family)
MPLPPSPRCVITGAGGGFGRALAIELAGRGAHLVLSDVDVKGVEETAALAGNGGARSVRAVRCDVTKIDDVKALAASCVRPVDLVVNNAGYVGELPIEDWRWTIEVDLFGVINGCHVFVPIMRSQGHGHILNVASAAGLLNGPMMGAYNVAKAGVIALSETLNAELVGTKINVTVLCPMFFQTNIAKSGRVTGDKIRTAFEGLVTKGATAQVVARAAMVSVDRGDLYGVPMADGRWLWRLKRMAPQTFGKLSGHFGKRALS